MVFHTPRPDFRPQMRVVACYIECGRRFLVLHRRDHKPQGNTWCIPGGKRDEDEDALTALLREIFEETGIRMERSAVVRRETFYVRYPDFDFIYERFSYALAGVPVVTLSPKEHKAFRWVTPEEALELPLIEDEDVGIRLRFGLAA